MTQPPPPPPESTGTPAGAAGGPSEAAWYYMFNAQRLGPVSTATLLSMAQSRAVPASTMVWREGMSTWAPIAGTPEFGFVYRNAGYGVTITTPPEGILGLTTTGFILFIVLLVMCAPLCWLPWVIKDLRAS